jgi:PAS domain S-box-containing protein
MNEKPTYPGKEHPLWNRKELDLLDMISTGVFVSTPKGEILEANSAVLKVFGYDSKKEFIKRKADAHWLDPKKDRKKFVELLRKEGGVEFFRAPFKRRDGRIIWGSITATIRSTEGGPLILTSYHDVTEHKQAEEKLQEISGQLTALIESIPDVVFFKDSRGRHVIVNRACEEQIGLERKNILGKTNEQLLPPDLAEQCNSSDSAVLKEYEAVRFEEKMIEDGGEPAFLETIKFPVFDEHRNMKGLGGVSRDITERKQVERALREEKDKAQQYLDIASVILVAINSQGEVTLINKKGCDLLGYREEEIVGKNWFDNFLPDRLKDSINSVSQQLLAGEIEPAKYYENPVLTKSGQERLIAWSNTVLRDETGDIIGHLSSGTDITDHKQAQEALRKSEARYRNLVETSPHGIQEIDMNGTITFANRAHGGIYGYAQEELVGLSILDLVASDDERIALGPYLAELVQKQPEPSPYVGQDVTKDGRVIDVQVDWDYKRDSDGLVTGFISVITDITERQQAQEALLKKESELKIKAKSLEEVNTALRVLLKEREKDKDDLEEKVLSNVKDLVLPYIERLKKTSLDYNQVSCIDLLKSNLEEIVSPFSRLLSSRYLGLTPTEIRVANLVKEGKTTKEIAGFMNLSPKTVEFHRDNIRKKLGISKSGTNLRTYLLSM